jgi:hypothetical protein
MWSTSIQRLGIYAYGCTPVYDFVHTAPRQHLYSPLLRGLRSMIGTWSSSLLCSQILELHRHPPVLLLFVNQQYHGLACEARLLNKTHSIFELLHIFLQEAHYSVIKNSDFRLPKQKVYISIAPEPLSPGGYSIGFSGKLFHHLPHHL